MIRLPRRTASKILVICALTTGTVPALHGSSATAQDFADPAFRTQWERTDRPVADGTVRRSYYWGPVPGEALSEPYSEGSGGVRLVQYFDKSRMEINNPQGDRKSAFFVTNGLLTVEMVSGRMQTGDSRFADRYAANIPLASDSDDPSAPTYASFSGLLDRAADKSGLASPLELDGAGEVSFAGWVQSSPEQTFTYYEKATGHNIPRVFWDFLNATGPIAAGTQVQKGRLSDPWFYATGYPISEPYWARVKIQGHSNTPVYVQAYQRRVLTYVPTLPAEFRVQMGNIGLHYFDWRYRGAGRPAQSTPVNVPVASPTPAQASPGRLVVSGAVTRTLSLDATALRAFPSQSVTATWASTGGEVNRRVYRGALLLDVLHAAGGQGKGGRDLPIRYIVASGAGGRHTLLSWAEIDPVFAGTKVVLAYEVDGKPLQNGNSVAQLIVPSDKTPARSLEDLTSIEVRQIEGAQPPQPGVLMLAGTEGQSQTVRAQDLTARSSSEANVTYMAGAQVAAHSYRGVKLISLLHGVGANEGTLEGDMLRYIVATSNDGRDVVLSWGEIEPALADVQVLVAYQESGIQFAGGSLKLVVPSDARGGRYLPALVRLEVRRAAP